MGRQANDGRGRLGGRAQGTKNKPQPAVNVWVDGLLNRNRRAVENAMNAPNGTQGTPILAALLVVSALDRLARAIYTASGLDAAEVDGRTDERPAL